MTTMRAAQERRRTLSKATDYYCATVGLVGALVMLLWLPHSHGALLLINSLFVIVGAGLSVHLMFRPARPAPARRRR
jgi:hypothetical protein